MDYSASIHDADHTAGSSPWGSSPQSSPNRSRNDFGSPAQPEPASSPALGPGGFNGLGAPAMTSPLPPASPNPNEADHDERPDTADTQESDLSYGPQGYPEHGPQGAYQHPQPQRYVAPMRDPSDYPRQDIQRQREGIQRQPSQRPAGSQYKLQAKITGLERTGRKDPILRFDVHTNLPKFRTTQFRDVRRTHSEFVKLAEHLISSNPEALVPAVPPALTSAGAGTDEDEARVKATMQRWLNYVCSNDVLMRDDEMVLFVESDFGYSPMVKRKQPATGVRRKVIKQFAPPPDDTPELQDARPIIKLFYLGAMDSGHKVDKLVKARRALGLAEADFGIKLTQLHVQEPHPGLSLAYRKLGKTIQTTGDFHSAQGTSAATTIGDPLQYHSQDAFIVKETLTNRHILLRELLQAQQTTRSKTQAADRLKSGGSVRREKVDEAISALEEARSTELYLTNKTQRVTQNLVAERRRWFQRTTNDMRQSIREYVLREIEAERRTLATLESIRPDIRAIDASGGLSRLGREGHPIAPRRTSLAASQGPRGDAWSGVKRTTTGGIARSVAGSYMGAVSEHEEDDEEGPVGRARTLSQASLGKSGLLKEEDDEDRVDARNAASRLATSTF